jgi:glutamine synthetase
MSAVREIADQLERAVPDTLWPLPKYSEILFIK